MNIATMIPWIFSMLLAAVALLVLGATAVLSLQCIAAFFRRPGPAAEPTVWRSPIAVLVPAHDEANGIQHTLEHIQAQLRPDDRLIVVADNCTDQTAEIARRAGATVLGRADVTRRGKNFALAVGLAHLREDPPDVVVFIDADTSLRLGVIDELASTVRRLRRPAQAVNLLAPPEHATGRDRLSALAFTTKNHIRPAGMAALGLPCLLTGTGMALPWEAIARVPDPDTCLVEDLQLGVDLAIAGYPAVLCQSAQVSGHLPASRLAAKIQRTRWEHGHLYTLIRQVPRLLLAGLRQRRFDLVAMALDVMVPPLSLLALGLFTLAVAAVSAGLTGYGWAAVVSLAFAAAVLCASLSLAWWRYGRLTTSLRSLLGVPFYVVWKIPIYFGFLFNRQKTWSAAPVRSKG